MPRRGSRAAKPFALLVSLAVSVVLYVGRHTVPVEDAASPANSRVEASSGTGLPTTSLVSWSMSVNQTPTSIISDKKLLPITSPLVKTSPPHVTKVGCRDTGAPSKRMSNCPVCGKNLRPCGARIYFLFMLMDCLHNIWIWKRFFAEAPSGAWRAWVHCKKPGSCRDSGLFQELPKFKVVDQVPSTRCKDLVSVEAQLVKAALRESVASNSVIQKFVLLSESALPVKPFSAIYEALTRHWESDFCLSRSKFWPAININQKNMQRISRYSEKKTLTLLAKHSQFFVLNRNDAKTFGREFVAVDRVGNWPVPLKSRRWKHRGWFLNTSGIVRFFDTNKPYYLPCADEIQVFATIYGTFDFGDFGDNEHIETCPLNRSVKCKDIASLMRQSRCRTLSVGGHNSVLVRKIIGDPGSTVRLPSKSRQGHGVEFKQLANTSLFRLRNSMYLFVRKFPDNASLPKYVDIMFQPFDWEHRNSTLFL